MTLDHILWVVSIFLTPLIAAGVAVLTYQQWNVARNKLKLDLFEKRWKIYDKAREFVAKYDRGDLVEMDLIETIGPARFLFDEAIHGYLNQIVTRIISYQTRKKRQEGLHPSDNSLEQAMNADRDWFKAQLGEMTDRFRPFMAIKA